MITEKWSSTGHYGITHNQHCNNDNNDNDDNDDNVMCVSMWFELFGGSF
jgi:hypothetical protein